jgi:hypothetical protein
MYTVFGYDDLCYDFEYTFNSFVKAVRKFRELEYECVTFMMRERPGTCMHVR